MYNFYGWYNVLFFTYLYWRLGPFNVIMLLYIGVSVKFVFQDSSAVLYTWDMNFKKVKSF